MIGGWLWSEENKGRVLLWYRSKRVKVEGWNKWSLEVTALTGLLISWKWIRFCTKFHKLKRKNDDFNKSWRDTGEQLSFYLEKKTKISAYLIKFQSRSQNLTLRQGDGATLYNFLHNLSHLIWNQRKLTWQAMVRRIAGSSADSIAPASW
jgi:hypothetical protein